MKWETVQSSSRIVYGNGQPRPSENPPNKSDKHKIREETGLDWIGLNRIESSQTESNRRTEPGSSYHQFQLDVAANDVGFGTLAQCQTQQLARPRHVLLANLKVGRQEPQL